MLRFFQWNDQENDLHIHVMIALLKAKLMSMNGLKPEVSLHIKITNVTDQVCHPIHIGWQQSVFHIPPDHVAEYSPKIFVTGVAQYASGVGEHPDEVRQ